MKLNKKIRRCIDWIRFSSSWGLSRRYSYIATHGVGPVPGSDVELCRNFTLLLVVAYVCQRGCDCPITGFAMSVPNFHFLLRVLGIVLYRTCTFLLLRLLLRLIVVLIAIVIAICCSCYYHCHSCSYCHCEHHCYCQCQSYHCYGYGFYYLLLLLLLLLTFHGYFCY